MSVSLKTSRRALLLTNTRARRGSSDLTMLRQKLGRGGLTLIEPSTESFESARLIREYADQIDLVIVGGGDGTINHALSALMETHLPLGVLPLGTANDLARTLEIPLDPVSACDVILQGNLRNIDVGLVNDRPFLNVANIGLAAEVTRRLSHSAKTRWGVLAYAWAAFGAMFSSRSFSVEISSSGTSLRTRSWQIAVGNGRFYGGGLTVHEKATINDGLLHLYSLEMRRRWQILPLIPAIWRGKLDPVLPVRTIRDTQFEIRPLKRVRSVIADGELVGQTPAVFKILPAALTVFVPGDASPGALLNEH